MKRIILTLLCLATLAATAQPPARRKAQQENENKTPVASAHRDFPTAVPMPDDAVWRRDIYREIDLTKEENAALYYPSTPQNGRENLFVSLFKLVLRGNIKAYDYKLDGNEDFSDDNTIKGKALMDRYQILYESKDGRIRVNDADLPSDEVRSYFVKESVYYNQHTATFQTKVTAICPVLKRGDDFGGMDAKYPMFWVKYEEAAPYLAKLMLMGSSVNNAAMISADDYFTLNLYKGTIYKTTNLQDKLLIPETESDTTVVKEQQRIEKELADFEKHVWGKDSVPPAATDSLAAATDDKEAEAPKATRRRGTSTRRSSGGVSAKKTRTKTKATKQRNSSSTRSRGTYSVRRQRH